MISLIACVDQNRAIGKDGALLFHLKDDLAFFRAITTGHKIIMGRKTWKSLPHKLKGRKNIVISHHDFPGPDQVIHDIASLISAYTNSEEEVFVIGGGMIYAEFLPYAHTIYLTEVDVSVSTADTFFPAFDKSQYSRELIKKGTENSLTYSIVKYNKGVL